MIFQWYVIVLSWTKTSKEQCTGTNITLYEKSHYQWSVTGIQMLPNFAQSMIKKILCDLDIDPYMDDISIWSNGSLK